MITIIILTAFTIATFSSYFWLKRRFLYWENRRVPYLQPDSFIFGNNYDAVIGKLSAAENIRKLYEALAPHRFGGVYNFYEPALFVRDPELIKNILIKDFHCFHDRKIGFTDKEDPLASHLSQLVGEERRLLRQKLSPTFTSGKMKMMFGLMKECAEKLEKIVHKGALDCKSINARDLMARYTTDVMCSVVFGLEADSLRNPNAEFLLRGRALMCPSRERRLKEAFISLSPAIARFLGLKKCSKDTSDFFMNLVSETIRYRTENGIIRNDFFNLLMDVQKGKTENSDFTTGFLAAQCFSFFLAGFETGSNTLTFILYELAEHLDVQRKLQEEIDRVLDAHGGEPTFDNVQELHYMDKVFNETCRLFSSVSVLPRVCTEDYRIPDSDYIIKRGDPVFIPIHGLHRDPQFYPDPDTFNPENFSDKAKICRPTCCFLPFGNGPRNCLGVRFAVMQVKLALTVIMRGYTVTLSPETKLPLELMPNSILTTPKNSILLNFQNRNVTENI